MAKIPKSLGDAVDDALKKGAKTRTAIRAESKAFSNVLPTIELKPSRVAKQEAPPVQETVYDDAPEGFKYETIMYKGEPTTVLVEDMDYFKPKQPSPQQRTGTKKDAMYDFLEQYYANPMNPRERIIGNALVELQMHGNDGMHLSSIRTLQPNSGESSKALKAVTDMADAQGMPITLYAQPYGNSGLKKKQLIEWYKRNGFVSEGGDYMVRKPK